MKFYRRNGYFLSPIMIAVLKTLAPLEKDEWEPLSDVHWRTLHNNQQQRAHYRKSSKNEVSPK